MTFDDDNNLRSDAKSAVGSLRGCSTGLSPFLDGWGASVYIFELRAAGCNVVDSGGIAGASRRVVAFSTCRIVGVQDIPFVYLSVMPVSGLVRPPIGDALGALDEAGFARDRDVGDVYGEENGWFAIAVDRRGIMPASVTEIETDGFVIERIDKSRFDKWAKAPGSVEVNVASVRLDSVLSGCTKLSRTKAKKLIEAGLVMVDYAVERKAEKPVEMGSIISSKGQKRVMVEGIEGPTKKGRFRVRYGGLL